MRDEEYCGLFCFDLFFSFFSIGGMEVLLLKAQVSFFVNVWEGRIRKEAEGQVLAERAAFRSGEVWLRVSCESLMYVCLYLLVGYVARFH